MNGCVLTVLEILCYEFTFHMYFIARNKSRTSFSVSSFLNGVA